MGEARGLNTTLPLVISVMIMGCHTKNNSVWSHCYSFLFPIPGGSPTKKPLISTQGPSIIAGKAASRRKFMQISNPSNPDFWVGTGRRSSGCRAPLSLFLDSVGHRTVGPSTTSSSFELGHSPLGFKSWMLAEKSILENYPEFTSPQDEFCENPI
jgi:hypothetical protein